MSHVRFSHTRRIARIIVLSVGFGALAIGSAPGQEGPAPGDRAWNAIRREADANRKEMAARFARLKALDRPAPVPAQLQVQAGIVVNRQPFPAPVLRRSAFVLTEEILVEPNDDAPAQHVRVYTEQAFDYYAFGDINGSEQIRSYLKNLLTKKISEISTSLQLTASQIEKLRLAGKGDIKRHFDEIEARRKEFAVVRMDPIKARVFIRDLVQSRATQSSLFEDGSLFARVLNQITESADGSRPGKPLPGSQLALEKALERADVIVAATDLRPLAQAGSSYPSFWCADATVTHCFKGEVARGTVRLNAIPIARFESLPTVRTEQEFLLFIERTEGNGIKLHRVIKMLPAAKDDVRFVEDALKR